MNHLPSALLLISSSCPHCPAMLQSLSELIKEGKIARLEVLNIEQDPAQAEILNVRSVPWLQIGDLELVGLKSKSEIQKWLDESTDNTDMSAYFEELMSSGELSKVQEIVEDKPQHMISLFNIMSSKDSTLSALVGVGAVIEQFESQEILIENIDALGEHCKNAFARIRNDACYYLGLSHHPDAAKYLRPLLNDEDEEVCEVAKEALEGINQ